MGSRFMVPGQFKDIMVKQQATGSMWQDRLRSACRGIIEKTGEDELYNIYQKHLPAPALNAVDELKSFSGADAFVRELCEQQETEEATSKRKKKKKKGRSSQDVRNSCNQTQLFFSVEGWQEVLKKGSKDRIK